VVKQNRQDCDSTNPVSECVLRPAAGCGRVVEALATLSSIWDETFRARTFRKQR